MNDPYDNGGTPKYSTAQDIYDALCELVNTEEMSILSEIGIDVSWENQTYYYTDKGMKLKENFERMSEYDDKMWLMDLTIMQMDESEIHGLVYKALINTDLAKRIGFKKLFVEKMLSGNGKKYAKITDDFVDELGELDYFDSYSMMRAFNKVTEANDIHLYGVSPYPEFAYYLVDKVRNLQLKEETKLIAECRAHLTAYDDFIFGLRANQALHEQQERMYGQRVAELQTAYNEKLKYLFMVADRAGLLPELTTELQKSETSSNALSRLCENDTK